MPIGPQPPPAPRFAAMTLNALHNLTRKDLAKTKVGHLAPLAQVETPHLLKFAATLSLVSPESAESPEPEPRNCVRTLAKMSPPIAGRLFTKASLGGGM